MTAVFSRHDEPGSSVEQMVNDVADKGTEYVFVRDSRSVAVLVGYDRYEEMRQELERLRA